MITEIAPETLITDLAARQIVLYLDSDQRLSYRAPRGALTPDMITAIQQQKAAIITALQARQDTEIQDAPDIWYERFIASADRALRIGGDQIIVSVPVSMSHEEFTRIARFIEKHQAAIETLIVAHNRRAITEMIRAGISYHAPDAGAPETYRSFGIRCAICLTREAVMYWKNAKPYCQQCRDADQYELPARQHSTEPVIITEPPAPATEPRQDTEPLPVVKPDATRKPRQWVTIFADIHAGRAITESGATFTFAPDCSLATFLQAARETGSVSRVYLCGDRPGGAPDDYIRWLVNADVLRDYTTEPRKGHYLDTLKPDASVARYTHRLTSETVDIRRITSWLGDDRIPGQEDMRRYSIEDARGALELLTRYVRQYFHKEIHLSGTPSGTFNRLWNEGNRIAGKQFPPLPDAIRALIHENAGQGRIEFFTENSTENGKAKKIPGLFYYDGIFMYAALTWGLPTELATHDTEPVYAGKVPARYRIRFTVPENWNHVGLFMTRRENGWFYPGADHPGETYETWVDGSELDIAFNLPDALPRWDITILERIVFKSEKDSAVTKPLTTITEKIVKLRDHLTRDARQDAGRAAIYKLASGAARNILLHGIGSFNRQSTARTYILTDTEPAPDGYTEYDEIDDHTRLYKVPGGKVDTTMLHPEYAALIWARCRARMTRAALAIAYHDIVTIRTDAIAVTRPVSQFEANNAATKVGLIRRKWAIEKPLIAPASDEKFDDLQRKVTRG